MSDDNEIRELVHSWMAATKAGDSATVLGLMTDEVVFLLPGQEPFGKPAFAEALDAQAAASAGFDGAGKWKIARDAGLLAPVKEPEGRRLTTQAGPNLRASLIQALDH